MNELSTIVDGERMTSLQIAEITGKAHKDIMRAIRNMEPAWKKVQERKFALLQEEIEISNGGHKMRPYFSLNKEECLYIATKFNDEARAKLIKRWKELEEQHRILQSNATMTVTQIAQDYGMSAMRLNKELESMRIQHKVRGQWILFAQFLEGGYVHSRAVDIVRSDGRHDVKYNTEWTTKGRIFLYESLKAKGILPLIEQDENPNNKGTRSTEPAKAASASQQTIKFN